MPPAACRTSSKGSSSRRDGPAARTPEQFADNDITVHVHHEVTAIDTAAGTLTVRDLDSGAERTEAWDELVVGTGAVGIRPPLDGIDAEGVMQLRVIEDAVEIDRRIRDGLRRARRGGRRLHRPRGRRSARPAWRQVTVLETADAPMAGTLDPDMAALVTEAVHVAGVDLRLGEAVQGFEVHHGRLTGVVGPSGVLPTELAVLSLGARPNTELAAAAGLPIGPANGIVVDSRMHTPVDGVWSAGDCVESRHRLTGEPVVVALGTHANKQGRVLGTNVAGGDARFPGVIGTAVTRFCETEIGRTGLTEAQAAAAGIEVLATTSKSRSPAHYYPGARR